MSMIQVNSLPWMVWSLYISKSSKSDGDYQLTLLGATIFWAFVEFLLTIALYNNFVVPPTLPINAFLLYWALVFVVCLIVYFSSLVYKSKYEENQLTYKMELKTRYVIRFLFLLGTFALIFLYQLPVWSLWVRILVYWGAQQLLFIILAFIEYSNVKKWNSKNRNNSENEKITMRAAMKYETGFYSESECKNHHVTFNLAIFLIYATFFIACFVVDLTQVFVEINTGWVAAGVLALFLLGYSFYLNSKKY